MEYHNSCHYFALNPDRVTVYRYYSYVNAPRTKPRIKPKLSSRQHPAASRGDDSGN